MMDCLPIAGWQLANVYSINIEKATLNTYLGFVLRLKVHVALHDLEQFLLQRCKRQSMCQWADRETFHFADVPRAMVG